MSTQTTAPSGKQASEQNRPAWMIVMIHQIMVTVRQRSFLVSTIITAALIVGGVFAYGYFSTKVSTDTVAVSTQAQAKLVTDASTAASDAKANVVLQPAVVADPVAEVREGRANLALVQGSDGWELTGKDDVSGTALGLLSQAVERATVQEHAGDTGVSWESLTKGSTLTPVLLNGDAQRTQMAFAVGYVFSMLFYLSALLFGMPIAASVIQEKSSRVIEILAATIPLRQLLAGKIAAACALAVVQLSLYVGLALLALNLSPADLGFMSVIISTAGWFLVFFVAGFLILAAVYAALGAMAHRAEDLQSSQAPVMFVLVGTLFAGMLAKGQVLVVVSFIPVVSSVTMPARMLQGDVPLWQTLLSLAIALATAALLVRLGGKIFRLAVLNTSGALSWRAALALKD